ncbi:large ribosomal subunit protein mL55 [Cynoglossus semilaevis]|uniref:large ribosomal subunit protein mL55 n=1 Tax=Cynoglossus semilaevis TaxID=244447 RepID=UPI000496087E|nr:39S ribosomal protein L55, mitochondrial [Cynoglossus semilaevis]
MMAANMFVWRLCFLHNSSSNTFSRCVRSVLPLCVQASSFHTHTAQFNSNRTSIACHSQRKFERLYPLLLVRPDGSTINIRYKEPKRIFLMPVDISTLSESDRRLRLKKREVKKTTKEKVVKYEDDFEAEKYSQFWKKK